MWSASGASIACTSWRDDSWLDWFQWRMQEFQNHGRGPGAVELLGSGDCFHSFTYVVRVGYKIHNVNIASWLQLKYICVLCSKHLQKQSQQIFQTVWGAPGAPVLDPPLGSTVVSVLYRPVYGWTVDRLTVGVGCTMWDQHQHELYDKLCWR